MVCLIVFLFCYSIGCPKQWDNAPPHAPHPAILLSNLLTIADTNTGLIVALHHQMVPPKAKALPLSLFFDGACIGAPHKGTSHGTTIPNGVRLAWIHGELQCHDLGALLLYP
jgi:hypothetical protein